MSEDEKVYYFMFSMEQLKMRKEVEKKINRDYKPKQVRVGSTFKEFTEKVTDPSNASYPDAKIVTSGKLSEMYIIN